MIVPSIRQLSGAVVLFGLISACAQAPIEPDAQATTARSHETVGVPAGDTAKQKQVPKALQMDITGLGLLILP